MHRGIGVRTKMLTISKADKMLTYSIRLVSASEGTVVVLAEQTTKPDASSWSTIPDPVQHSSATIGPITLPRTLLPTVLHRTIRRSYQSTVCPQSESVELLTCTVKIPYLVVEDCSRAALPMSSNTRKSSDANARQLKALASFAVSKPSGP